MTLSSLTEWRTKKRNNKLHLPSDRIAAIIQAAGYRGVRHVDLIKAIDISRELVDRELELLRGVGEISISKENGEIVCRSMRKLGGLLSGDLHHVAGSRFIGK